MTFPDLIPGTRYAYNWLQCTIWPRRWAWTYALTKVRGDAHDRVDVPTAMKACHGVFQAEELPEWDVFTLWAEEAHRHLMDDGPVQQTIQNLRTSKATILFQRNLASTHGKTARVNILGTPGAPVLTGILPTFRGVVPPSCYLRWNAAIFSAEVVAELVEPKE